MSKIIPNENFISKNWEKTISVIKSLSASNTMENIRIDILQVMLDELCEKYSFAPASSRKEYFSSFPGGLCYHNLCVMKWLFKLSNTFEQKFSKNSLVTISILHELGKIGTREEDYYIKQESDWHIKKGIYYEINPKIQYMKVPHRSLWLAQIFNIPLTEEEYLSIVLYDGEENNNTYKYKEPTLAQLFRMAYQWSIKMEKNNQVNWI
jgi:hypothetical protein